MDWKISSNDSFKGHVVCFTSPAHNTQPCANSRSPSQDTICPYCSILYVRELTPRGSCCGGSLRHISYDGWTEILYLHFLFFFFLFGDVTSHTAPMCFTYLFCPPLYMWGRWPPLLHFVLYCFCPLFLQPISSYYALLLLHPTLSFCIKKGKVTVETSLQGCVLYHHPAQERSTVHVQLAIIVIHWL